LSSELEIKIFDKVDKASTFEEGFRILVENYQEKLYWHIRRIVHIHDDADDVLQNTFIKVFKNLSTFKRESKLYTWLYRIATNEALSFLKKKKTSFALDDPDLYIEKIVTADSYFDAEEANVLLLKAIDRLPQKQKLVFNMRYYDEMDYKSISEVLMVSVGGLKASYHHALKKVEQYLVDNYDYSNG